MFDNKKEGDDNERKIVDYSGFYY
ncbi:MAG: hypothetical protein UX51_C0010G0012, partial [Candidatus Azambacteria bacterium GW2011_GWF2_46_32]